MDLNVVIKYVAIAALIISSVLYIVKYIMDYMKQSKTNNLKVKVSANEIEESSSGDVDNEIESDKSTQLDDNKKKYTKKKFPLLMQKHNNSKSANKQDKEKAEKKPIFARKKAKVQNEVQADTSGYSFTDSVYEDGDLEDDLKEMASMISNDLDIDEITFKNIDDQQATISDEDDDDANALEDNITKEAIDESSKEEPYVIRTHIDDIKPSYEAPEEHIEDMSATIDDVENPLGTEITESITKSVASKLAANGNMSQEELTKLINNLVANELSTLITQKKEADLAFDENGAIAVNNEVQAPVWEKGKYQTVDEFGTRVNNEEKFFSDIVTDGPLEDLMIVCVYVANHEDVKEKHGEAAATNLNRIVIESMRRVFGGSNPYKIKNNEYAAIIFDENPDTYHTMLSHFKDDIYQTNTSNRYLYTIDLNISEAYGADFDTAQKAFKEANSKCQPQLDEILYEEVNDVTNIVEKIKEENDVDEYIEEYAYLIDDEEEQVSENIAPTSTVKKYEQSFIDAFKDDFDNELIEATGEKSNVEEYMIPEEKAANRPRLFTFETEDTDIKEVINSIVEIEDEVEIEDIVLSTASTENQENIHTDIIENTVSKKPGAVETAVSLKDNVEVFSKPIDEYSTVSITADITDKKLGIITNVKLDVILMYKSENKQEVLITGNIGKEPVLIISDYNSSLKTIEISSEQGLLLRATDKKTQLFIIKEKKDRYELWQEVTKKLSDSAPLAVSDNMYAFPVRGESNLSAFVIKEADKHYVIKTNSDGVLRFRGKTYSCEYTKDELKVTVA